MSHVEKVMRSLTERFGEPELKIGQSRAAIQRSWQRVFGLYDEKDVIQAARYWADTAKYPRWPEVGELHAILKEFGKRPVEIVEDNRSPEVKAAEAFGASWYAGIVKQPSPAFGITNSYLLGIVLKDAFPDVQGTFGFLLTRAVLNGILPDEWEWRSQAMLEKMTEKKVDYKKAVEKYGMVAVNESNGKWQTWAL